MYMRVSQPSGELHDQNMLRRALVECIVSVYVSARPRRLDVYNIT